MLKGIRWGAGWCLRRRPRTNGGLVQTTALVDRPSDQSIVKSAGKQIGQASKQENEQCGSNPPKGVPQANSLNTWALARQGGYLWPIANWEQRYATLLSLLAVPSRGGRPPPLMGAAASLPFVTVRQMAPTLRDPDSPEICPTNAYFKLFRWRPTCDHLVAHQPQPQSQYFPGIRNPRERAPT